MRLRAWRLFLLSILFALAGTLPCALAQSPSDAELEALNNRVISFYRAGKYGDAIPLAERYAAGTKARYGENAPEYATALNNLGDLFRLTSRVAEAEPLLRRALVIDEKSFGPNHLAVGRDLNNLALLLYNTNRLSEAEPSMRRVIAIFEKSLGPDNPNVGMAINNLGELLRLTNRLAEAEPLMHRALKIDETILGPYHPNVGRDLNNLARLLYDTNRLAEAEPLMRRALEIDEKSLGSDHPDVGRDVNNLAGLLHETNRLAEAEPLMRRAIMIFGRSFGPEHPNAGTASNNLARLLLDTNRLAEAEPMFRRALMIDEKSLGPDHPNVGRDLSNLAQLLQAQNQLAEAEPLMRRALKIDEASYGPDHPEVAVRLNNLAELLRLTNRYAEAEQLLRRAIAIDEKSLGPDHPDVALRLNNLAVLFHLTSRLSEAEPLMRRALQIDEKSFGPEHPAVSARLNNLGLLLKDTNRISEAEPLMRRALQIDERSLGPNHPDVALRLNNLASLLEDQGDWSGSIALRARAKTILIGGYRASELARATLINASLTQNTGDLRAHARAIYHANAKDAAMRAEGFELAQWALQNSTADALSSMAARFAKGDRELGKLSREHQDLLSARDESYRKLDGAAGKADPKAGEAARAAITEIEANIAEKQARLRQYFPDYAELDEPRPLPLREAQALLGERQALVLFLDLWQVGRVPEETIVFALTKKAARWASLPLGTFALRQRVAALRCGLDNANWRVGANSRDSCKALLGTEVTEDKLPPFDAAAAHSLYRDLFGGIEDLIKDKSLLIVPSGALTQLPFEVLVTKDLDDTLPRFEAYKTAAWLGQRQGISVLPSVGSLKALRVAKSGVAGTPLIGFGNPLLDGVDGKDKRAWAEQACPKSPSLARPRVASRAPDLASIFRNGQPSAEDLRHQPPLPETADELCEVAHSLWVPESGLDDAVYLGSRATVTQVKALSKSGALARARMVHFATHGLLAGDTAFFAKNRAEPALLLTPPDAGKESEEDNGLLTASEVAQLNLNADWVVMSACNTAAGSNEGAEALSGLARAFIYAGARSLLVSHWEVNSEAAVAITTGAVNAMKAEPKIGRAEALRRSIAALIAKGGDYAHPSVWAPFVLVGNGEQ